MSTSSITTEINQYYNLLYSLNTTLSLLNSAKDNVNDSKKLSSYYIIDDSPYIGQSILDNSVNSIDSIIYTIEKEIIPWINAKINNLKNELELIGSEM